MFCRSNRSNCVPSNYGVSAGNRKCLYIKWIHWCLNEWARMLWCLEYVPVPAEPSKEAGAGFTSQGFSCDLNSEIQIDKAPYRPYRQRFTGWAFCSCHCFLHWIFINNTRVTPARGFNEGRLRRPSNFRTVKEFTLMLQHSYINMPALCYHPCLNFDQILCFDCLFWCFDGLPS